MIKKHEIPCIIIKKWLKLLINPDFVHYNYEKQGISKGTVKPVEVDFG